MTGPEEPRQNFRHVPWTSSVLSGGALETGALVQNSVEVVLQVELCKSVKLCKDLNTNINLRLQ